MAKSLANKLGFAMKSKVRKAELKVFTLEKIKEIEASVQKKYDMMLQKLEEQNEELRFKVDQARLDAEKELMETTNKMKENTLTMDMTLSDAVEKIKNFEENMAASPTRRRLSKQGSLLMDNMTPLEGKSGEEAIFPLTEDQLEAMEELKGDNEKVNFLIDIVSAIQTEGLPKRI